MSPDGRLIPVPYTQIVRSRYWRTGAPVRPTPAVPAGQTPQATSSNDQSAQSSETASGLHLVEGASTARRRHDGEILELTIDGSRPHVKRTNAEQQPQGFSFVDEAPVPETTPVATSDDWPSGRELKPLRSLLEEPEPQPAVRPSGSLVRSHAPGTRSISGSDRKATSTRATGSAGRVTIAEFGTDDSAEAAPAESGDVWWSATSDQAPTNQAHSSEWRPTQDKSDDAYWMPTAGHSTAATRDAAESTDLVTVGMGLLLLPVGLNAADLAPHTVANAAALAQTSVPSDDSPASEPASVFMPAQPGPEIVYTNVGTAKPAAASNPGESAEAGPGGPLRPSRRVVAIPTDVASAATHHWTPETHPATPGMDLTYIELTTLLDDDLRSLSASPVVPADGEDDSDSPSDSRADDSAGGSAGDDKQTLGEAPEETNDSLQFLRRQTVLLDPGEFQFDTSLSYLNDQADFAVLVPSGNGVSLQQAKTRQRLLYVPLEVRAGITKYTQGFVNVPFGYSHSEVAFNGKEVTKEEGGIGDVSAGLTQQVVIGNEYYPDVLASVSFSAPSGNSSISQALSTPGSSLGQGFWTLTGSLSFIQSIDPVVFFYGVGYTFRFESTFSDVIEIDPGDQIFYRFGAGFAMNPHVTLSAAFTGSFIGRDIINGNGIAGSIREPMNIRLAATISERKSSKTHKSFKIVEPFVNFGLNEDSIDAFVGITWTH